MASSSSASANMAKNGHGSAVKPSSTMNKILPPSGTRGVPMPRPTSASSMKTYPSTPNFATADRASVRRRNATGENKPESAKSLFHAQPVNWRMLASPTVGVKKVKPQSPTRPVPFALKTEDRQNMRNRFHSGDQGGHGDLAQQFKPIASSSVITTAPKPQNHGRPPLIAQPLHFRTDQRAAEHKEKRQRVEEKEAEERRRRLEFRAAPMPDFNKPVFCPVLLEKRVTEADNVRLESERRAAERKQFEERLKQQESEKLKEQQRRQLERQREEEEEIRRQRAAAVHKAQPIRQYKPVEIKHDIGQITVPVTPHFRVDRRLLERPPSRNFYDSQRF